MKLLAIDTSTRMGSVALLNEKKLIAQIYLDCDLTYSERLLATIQQTLQLARWNLDEVQGLAMAIGPGSFTALRVGLATMKGIALSKNLPLVGVSSLEALSGTVVITNKVVVPMLDARREEVYTGAFRFHPDGRKEVLLPDCAIRPEALLTHLKTWGDCWLFGEGLEAYRDFFTRSVPPNVVLASHPIGPTAFYVGTLGLDLLQRGYGKEGVDLLLPNYLRPSDAEINSPLFSKA